MAKTKRWVIITAAFYCFLTLMAVLFFVYLMGSFPITEEARVRKALKRACYYSEKVFKKEPDRVTISLNDLISKGFNPDNNIEITILDNKKDSLKIAAQLKHGSKQFVVNKSCVIIKVTAKD